MKIPDEFQNLKPYDMSLYTYSFVSGKQQNYIDVQYYHDGSLLKFYVRVLFHVETQGAPGIVHGGAIASVMDEKVFVSPVSTYLSKSPSTKFSKCSF